MAEYQGHASKAAWNVSLWINNDEGLYRLAQEAIRLSRTRGGAAVYMLQLLPARTPDGYRYTKSALKAAISDIEA